jgi:hypothetical protein
MSFTVLGIDELSQLHRSNEVDHNPEERRLVLCCLLGELQVEDVRVQSRIVRKRSASQILRSSGFSKWNAGSTSPLMLFSMGSGWRLLECLIPLAVGAFH